MVRKKFSFTPKLSLKSLKKILLKLFALYAVIVVFMYVFQRNFIYFPFGDIETLPPSFQEISIKIDKNNSIYGWYHPASNQQKTILYFHGNAGNLGGRAQRLEKFSSQYGVLAISYRGYAKSQGKPSEKNFFDDADYALQYLQSLNIDTKDIIVFGESIGSGVALNLGSNHKFATIVLEAPFTSILDIAKETYWFLPVSLILKDKFESAKLANKITSPILIFHAKKDNIVPFSQGESLYKLFNYRKKFIAIDGNFHIGLDGDFLIKELNDFLIPDMNYDAKFDINSDVNPPKILEPKILEI